MPALQFTRDLALLIVAGRKTQTLRAKLPPGLVVGSRVTMLNGYNGSPTFGHAIVKQIDEIAIAALTRADAIRDGFATTDELFKRLYAMNAPSLLWRIQWRDFEPNLEWSKR